MNGMIYYQAAYLSSGNDAFNRSFALQSDGANSRCFDLIASHLDAIHARRSHDNQLPKVKGVDINLSLERAILIVAKGTNVGELLSDLNAAFRLAGLNFVFGEIRDEAGTTLLRMTAPTPTDADFQFRDRECE